MILDAISKPSDLKRLSITQLKELCAELRNEIVRIVYKNGGHLGSNLGSVELIVAAHYVFDIECDKFIFDVGHQSYAHKLLTGRRELMENLRTVEGAAGFPDPSESKYDHFMAGHASTSLSAALGIAKARDLAGLNYKVLSILGDGSLSGGMIYEAMNNAAGTSNFIVILNDNQMSISESVGAMRRYLSKLLASRGGLSFRRMVSRLLSVLPRRLSKQIETFVKGIMSAIYSNNIFEEFGFQYIGAIDGHNLEELIKVFENVRDVATYKPVLIHTLTEKGKGCPEAEHDATKLHGLDKSKGNRFADVFGKTILRLAERDPKIVCITAAMKTGTGLANFAIAFPERFFDVGIAEEHAVTFAAGLATQGFKPFVCIYSTFLQRAFDQIFHDVVLQNLPVRFVIDKAGFPGSDGKTHAGLYDVSLLQNFPNFTIMSPPSRMECERMVEFMANCDNAPSAIRFPKAEATDYDVECGDATKSRVVAEGSRVLIISTGALLEEVLKAVEISGTTPTIIDARFVQPFDFATFYRYAKTHEKIIVLEEGVWGGVSNVILQGILDDGQMHLFPKLHFLTASKKPVVHASRTEQLHVSQLSAETLAKALIE
ncbi:MAG: 1-deoxy-D-xylulose-5-phosphate synthase [Alphaproteobacteria bacterium]|nr:1-deoxy-D-xylulose-5-phosphate synthase [Alphaproteobacteria bacterium]